MVVDKLEAVPVSAQNGDLHPLPSHPCGQGADQVVGLVSGELRCANPHRVEDLLDQRHLQGKVIRHRFAGRLVPVIRLMSERRLFAVKHRANVRGREFLHRFEIDVEKTEQRPRGGAVRCSQRPSAGQREIRAVDDTVSI